MRKLTTPLTEEDVKSLHAGDHVLLSGVVYTARDAAHLRMMDLIRAGKPLPVDLAGQVIYYAGPTPTPPGRPVGSIGPTTSTRMDSSTPTLLQHGLRGMIGGVKVYNKFSSGDPDTSKTAASWFGACIFLIVAATILRSFFL